MVLPIYGFRLRLVVADSVGEAMKQDGTAQPDEDLSAAGAMFAYEDGNSTGTIYLERAFLNPGVIAHEVFHATHRIMEFVENDLTRCSHEPHCYLCQFITDWVYHKIVLEWKEKMRIITS